MNAVASLLGDPGDMCVCGHERKEHTSPTLSSCMVCRSNGRDCMFFASVILEAITTDNAMYRHIVFSSKSIDDV